MFNKILIANRGEIACRIIRTAKRMGICCVAVYSQADKSALHVELADQAFCLGSAPVSESYLRIDKIIDVAKKSGAQGIHPGYGFLSENPKFVEACIEADIVFIGPSADAIRAMGLKDAAKALMVDSGVPVVPGYHGDNQNTDFLNTQANSIGYPILIKARAGGGGKGMRKVEFDDEFIDSLESAQREAQSSFADSHVIIEKFINTPRHIEIQIFSDQFGNTVHLFERDCSMQRRHQKVIEESPAPGMTESLRSTMGDAAVRAAKAVNYVGAGTVEFIVDSSQGLNPDGFFFMEMNTRLQVEHPVTEAITGLDLVEWQLRVAAGEQLPKSQSELSINGHAIETRIYAEDAQNNFLPSTGRLDYLSFPDDQVRVDSGVRRGDEITPYYDPMIAKLIAHGSSRESALAILKSALSDTQINGCATNVNFLSNLLANTEFTDERLDTGLIDRDLETLTQRKKPNDQIIAIAALSALGHLAMVDSNDPWFTLAGWRHFSAAKQYAHICFDGEEIEVTLMAHADKSLELFFHNHSLLARIESIDGHNVCIDFGDQIVKAVMINQQDTLTIFSDSHSYQFNLPDGGDDFVTFEQSEATVLAPMPGLITAVNVIEGQAVSKSDVMIVMEAMKMEHSLRVSMTGLVEQVNVTVGDQVKEGDLLFRMEQQKS